MHLHVNPLVQNVHLLSDSAYFWLVLIHIVVLPASVSCVHDSLTHKKKLTIFDIAFCDFTLISLTANLSLSSGSHALSVSHASKVHPHPRISADVQIRTFPGHALI